MDLVTSILIPAVSSFGTAFLTKGDGGVAETFRAIWYNHVGFRYIERQKDIQKQREDARQNHTDLLPQIEAMQNELNVIQADQQKFLEQLAPLVSNIDEENLISPRREIAIPTLDALEIYGTDKDIRNMFAKLLASSMDQSRFDEVRPSFVQMIKEMSPIDAILLNDTKEAVNPIASIIWRDPSDNSYTVQQSNVLPYSINNFSVGNVAASIDNLQRLGLINIDNQHSQTTFDYSVFKKTPAFSSSLDKLNKQISNIDIVFNNFPALASPENSEGNNMRTAKRMNVELLEQVYLITNLGKSFRSSCID